MNRPIRNVAMFCMFLFLALMVNATYLQFWAAEDLNEKPDNARATEAAFSRERGEIRIGDNMVLARSRKVDDRYEFLRVYPHPLEYAHITGYLRLTGQTGLEDSQNAVLSGEDKRLFVNQLVDMVRNRSNQGGNVLLTLDPEAQQAAYDALLDVVGPDGEGSVVAIQPKTGRILAMVSLPTYDPNNLATHDFAAADRAQARLDDNEDEPLLNRAIRTRLFPGSTYKIVTAAAGLEAGLFDDPDDMVDSGATYQPGGIGNAIDNEGRSQCDAEEITAATAMAWSCNTAFGRMAVEVGAGRMREQAERFGFNRDYLEDLSGQVRSAYPDKDLDDQLLAQTGFGQYEVQATPLQMAMVVAAIANRGTLMRPYLVEEVQSADFETLETADPDEFGDALSPSSASVLTDLMVATVNEGTAGVAAIPGIEVAGKTGTAQRDGRACGDPQKLPPYAWFTSFAPAEDAEVAVAVMIESAPTVSCDAIAGGTLGGPVARAVMEAVINE